MDAQEPPPDAAPVSTPRLLVLLLGYSALRVLLVVALTIALSFLMPLIVAALFALIVQLPLSWLLLSRPRRRVNEAITGASGSRRAERARLQSALSGDEPEPPGP